MSYKTYATSFWREVFIFSAQIMALSTVSAADQAVVEDLQRFLASSKEESLLTSTTAEVSLPLLFDKSSTAVPVAAIKALLCVVQRSQAGTMMGLQDELHQAMDCILQYASSSGASAESEEQPRQLTNYKQSPIALQSGCQLFLRYITRTFLEVPDFNECRRVILTRGEYFHHISLAARDRVATHGAE
jgi:hypothetical protein